jgi:hypothetical protein
MKMNYQHPALAYHNPITGEYNEDMNENGLIYVEATYEVCSTCGGHGSHFRSDLDENALIDGMREDGDEDGIDSYYGGAFDQICSECRGQRVVSSPMLPEWANEAIYQWRKSENESRAIRDAERRVGA